MQKIGLDLNKELDRTYSLSQYDVNITSKIFGYKSAQDFYEKVSCTQKLLQAKIPTLILMARDDPIIGDKTIDEDLPQ